MVKYYVDTCVWIDFYENREGFGGKDLGKVASDFFMKTLNNKDTILYSETVVNELEKFLGKKNILNLFNFFFCFGLLKRVKITDSEGFEAKKLAKERKIPRADALHAIIARDNDSILVTQDKHFYLLKDIVKVEFPD